MSLRWLLRCPRRHSRRTVLLIDATAVCGAVAKGRSSAPTIARELRHIAALSIAGDLLLRVVYVPSEDNPGDASSRGIVRSWRHASSPCAGRRVRKSALKRDVDPNSAIQRPTSTGSIHSKNTYRRLFRHYDWSDVSSLSSLALDDDGVSLTSA